MPSVATAYSLDALTHRGRHGTKAQAPINGVDDIVYATTSVAPRLLIAQTVQAQAKATPTPAADRPGLFQDAANIFAHHTIDGVSFEDHCRLVSIVSGHGPAVTAQASHAVTAALATAQDRADQARPRGTHASWHEVQAGTGRSVWTRRGATLGAVLSGNSPTIQNGWLQALALGYRVAVRPSRREPFTAYRTIRALRLAGFRDTDATYLPSDHGGAEEILRRSDLGFVYGGDDLVAKYGTTPAIKVHGPGRTKTLLTSATSAEAHIEDVARSVATLSGTGCINTSAAFIEGDHLAFAARLATRLEDIAEARRSAGDHLGPRVSTETAETIRAYLQQSAGQAAPVIPLERTITVHPDGGAVLGPAVFTVDTPYHPLLSAELPFPFVTIGPWAPEDGLEPLRNSLIVNAVITHEALIDALLNEPSIRNVHLNTATTYSDPMIPHEDYVGSFLMRNKAVVRDA